MQSSYYEDCCSGPSALIPDAGNKCEICPSGKDWYAQVIHEFKPMTCLELDSVLLQGGVFDDSAECEQAKMDYSSLASGSVPLLFHDNQSLIDSSLANTITTISVLYSAATPLLGDPAICAKWDKNPSALWNKLCPTMEPTPIAMAFTIIFGQGSKQKMMLVLLPRMTCLTRFVVVYYVIILFAMISVLTQPQRFLAAFFVQCCYARCSICQDYQLDQEMFVTHDGSKMACSEIENHYMGMNQITKASEQCARIQQQHW